MARSGVRIRPSFRTTSSRQGVSDPLGDGALDLLLEPLRIEDPSRLRHGQVILHVDEPGQFVHLDAGQVGGIGKEEMGKADEERPCPYPGRPSTTGMRNWLMQILSGRGSCAASVCEGHLPSRWPVADPSGQQFQVGQVVGQQHRAARPMILSPQQSSQARIRALP